MVFLEVDDNDYEVENFGIEFEEPKTQDFTVEDIFNALKKNGFEHLRGMWYSGDETAIGACVLGQAALNLNSVDKSSLDGEDQEANRYSVYRQLNAFSIPNDSKWIIPNSPDVRDAGDIIIYWNDATKLDRYGVTIKDEDNNVVYMLPTYQDVVNMAYDVLAPHFYKLVTLVHYDY